MRTVGDMTLFFSEADAFSNWYRADFSVKGIRFNCVEQFMMYCKAKLFADHAAAEKIMKTIHPRDQKALGRRVIGYNDDVWVAKRQSYVFHGCVAKFMQNPELQELLLSTGSNILVEASPYDRIWGVGLSETDPAITDSAKWRGQNLLGQVLVAARTRIAANLQASHLTEQERPRMYKTTAAANKAHFFKARLAEAKAVEQHVNGFPYARISDAVIHLYVGEGAEDDAIVRAAALLGTSDTECIALPGRWLEETGWDDEALAARITGLLVKSGDQSLIDEVTRLVPGSTLKTAEPTAISQTESAAEYARKFKAVHAYTGEARQEVQKALLACDNDALAACGYLHFSGSLVNLKGVDHQAWLLNKARSYAVELVMQDDGSIARRGTKSAAPEIAGEKYGYDQVFGHIKQLLDAGTQYQDIINQAWPDMSLKRVEGMLNAVEYAKVWADNGFELISTGGGFSAAFKRVGPVEFFVADYDETATPNPHDILNISADNASTGEWLEVSVGAHNINEVMQRMVEIVDQFGPMLTKQTTSMGMR